MRLCAALLSALLAACQPGEQDQATSSSDTEPTTEAPSDPAQDSLCGAPVTPIADVQGTGFVSPMAGQPVTVRGVVTLTARDGLYIQEARPIPAQPASQGIYIASTELAGKASKGTLVTVSGTVEELGESDNTLTALGGTLAHELCGEGPEPPEIDARLPRSDADREAFEAMYVRLDQGLTVTAVRDVHRGKIMVSALGILRAPTEVVRPGDKARAQALKNHEWSLPVLDDALRELDPYTKIHTGAVINSVRGVLAHDGRQLSLLAEDELQFVPKPPPNVPDEADDAVRVVSLNLFEYFNGDGRGGGFPGERGAESERKFRQQVERIMAAIEALAPDVLGVMELENDGFGPLSSVHHLRRQVSQALGAEYAVAEPRTERVGSDAIAVGLIYRSDRVTPLGPAHLLEGGSLGPLNRVPIAQAFSAQGTGERFLVVVNHLKSKGSCPGSGPDLAQGDGQACWNPTRVEGALETLRWARQLAAEGGTDHILLVGDFNAYRMEDPVRALRNEGLIELVEHKNPSMPQYSYVYQGAAGTLDYAFASESLAEQVGRAFIWHINAAYPWSDRPSAPWLRGSDHDPVVVDLRFNQAATSD